MTSTSRLDSSAAESGNLTQRIVEELGIAIVTQRLPAHTLLPFDAQLCEQFDASRPVVREAVKMLTAKGLLNARKRVGTMVEPEDHWNLLDPDILRWMLRRAFSFDLLVDFTEMRMAIEPRAAGLAAHGASGQQRQALALAMDRMLAAERGEDDTLEADIAFHRAVILGSNNRFMRQFADLSEATLRFSIGRTNAYPHIAHATAGDHCRVGEAIIRGDAVKASRMMRDLIQIALDILLSVGGMEQRPTI